jgi:zinc and cadmium transporter
MPNELLSVVFATLLISSGSFVGVLAISLNQQFLSKILLSLVSLSAGTMLSAALLHLLPESIEVLGGVLPFQLTLLSFITFFVLERFLHWRHCHDKDHLAKHTIGTMNLVEMIHNFLDGVLIAASFATGGGLGHFYARHRPPRDPSGDRRLWRTTAFWLQPSQSPHPQRAR